MVALVAVISPTFTPDIVGNSAAVVVDWDELTVEVEAEAVECDGVVLLVLELVVGWVGAGFEAAGERNCVTATAYTT